MRKKTQEQFVLDAKNIHGDKYSYDKVEYKGWDVKVVIECRVHGDFKQGANSHLQGRGCPKCGRVASTKGWVNHHLNNRNWDFEQPEDHKLVPLTQGYFAMVDNEDFNKVKDINWYYTNGYAMNDKVGLMHRYIMNAPEHLDVDHEHHDTLDNRKSELRLATTPQNMANLRPQEGSSSKYVGVSWNKFRERWESAIKNDGKRVFIGYFEDEDDAGRARDLKAMELKGEFAYLNFPELKEEYLKVISNRKRKE